MALRPVYKEQIRPISAIYLGKDANLRALQSTPSSSSHTEATSPSPRLPDLPEPPSLSSSVGSVQSSGLPSPPRSNSNGSESTGDPGSISFRERSLSHHRNSSNSINSGTGSTPMKRMSEADYDDYDEEICNDNDGNDDTVRLIKNVMALQRAKSLDERNRMVSFQNLFITFTLIASRYPSYNLLDRL